MKKTDRKSGTVLVLRSCGADMSSYEGFKWPKKGLVEAPDWDPKAVCGYGLHGFLKGEGDASLAHRSDDAKWLVVEVQASDIVDLKGKVKFPRGNVLYAGVRDKAVAMIQEAYPGAAVIYGKATAGNYGQATAGDSGQATAGNYGQATAGDSGQATAGDSGKATAGDSGQATAGNYGKATAGNYGKATAGEKGILLVEWYDTKAERKRIVIGYVGEDGIKANKTYKVIDGKLVLVD